VRIASKGHTAPAVARSSRARPFVGESMRLVREPDAGDLHVRFDERDVETERRRGYSGTARRKGRQQTNWTYCHRATSRLYRSAKFAGVRFSSEPQAATGPIAPSNGRFRESRTVALRPQPVVLRSSRNWTADRGQRSISRGDAIGTHVQPVSLHTLIGGTRLRPVVVARMELPVLYPQFAVKQMQLFDSRMLRIRVAPHMRKSGALSRVNILLICHI
jgi:hypothetical protein